jgi:hypothetical protein
MSLTVRIPFVVNTIPSMLSIMRVRNVRHNLWTWLQPFINHRAAKFSLPLSVLHVVLGVPCILVVGLRCNTG